MSAPRRPPVLALLAWPFRFVWLNLELWARFLFYRPLGAAFEAGDLLIVRRPLTLTVLTHWLAPYTGGFTCTLPAGTRLRVREAAGRRARGLPCVPDDRDAFERQLVPEEERRHPKYAGCSLVLDRRELAACEVVTAGSLETPRVP